MYNWADFGAISPVIVLVLGGSALLLSEVFLKSGNRGYQSWVSAALAVLAGVLAFGQFGDPARDLFGGFARLDGFGAFAGVLVCFALALTSLIAGAHLKEHAAERGEFHGLAHLGAAGMILLAVATDLLTMFVALEVMSLATYALTAWLRHSPRPAEAGLKYFVLGSFSSAIFLYGASLAYGFAGSTRLVDLAAAVQGGAQPGLVGPALALIAAGFFFKVAAVPFHSWAPDVYQGAPTPVTGFMAAGVKVAAFGALLRVFFVGFGSTPEVGLPADWYSMTAVLAILSMVIGNLLALAQKSIKRMLTYSSISHAGYILVGVAAGAHEPSRQLATQATLFYLAAYTATAVGAFAVVAALEKRGGRELDDDTRYDGLAQRYPALALAMAVFMLSLAGIPPTAGFAGKLLVFRAAINADAISLAVIGLLSSVIGLYYYLRVVVVMYFRPVSGEQVVPLRTTAFGLGLGAAAVATVVFGVGPGWLSELARTASALSP
jgi:NADH-quinone oxidoreductase subunit N